MIFNTFYKEKQQYIQKPKTTLISKITVLLVDLLP